MTMKQLTIFALVLFIFASVQAQEQSPKTLKKQGYQAYKAQNYKEALKLWEKAINMFENDTVPGVDTALYYNTGILAYKSKNYNIASDKFESSAKLGFKPQKCYKYRHHALKKLLEQEKSDDLEEAKMDSVKATYRDSMITNLQRAIDKFPDNDQFKEDLSTQYYKDGVKPYNKATTIIKEAESYREDKPEKFEKELEKAKEKFKEALEPMKKAHKLTPRDKGPMQALTVIYTNLGKKDKAKKIDQKINALEQKEAQNQQEEG